MRKGKLPKAWELANVTPFCKSGDKQNYSLVSSLVIIRKHWVEALVKTRYDIKLAIWL